MWKKPEDVRLPIHTVASIWFDMVREDVDGLSSDATIGALIIGGQLFVQCIWYFILKHNSPANTATFLSSIGCFFSAFFLGILTIICFSFAVFCIYEAKEKIDESHAIEEYRRRSLEKKKVLFEKIDKQLLGDNYEL